MSNCEATPEVKRIIRAMAKAKLEDGMTDAHDIVDAVHAAIRDHTPLWKNEIADIIAGIGEKRKATKTELQERLTQLRRDLKSAFHPDAKDAAKNAARQKAIRAQIAKIDGQLKSGDFSKAPPRPKPQYDAETQKLQAALDRARDEADVAEQKLAFKAKGPVFKALNLAASFSRAMVLLSIGVFEHLGGATAWRAVSTVLEDAAGAPLRLSSIYRRLDDAATLEGGGFLGGGQAAGLRRVFSKETLQMMKDKLLKAASDRDLMYGNKGHHASNWPALEVVGRTHDLVKTPLEQHEFGRALYRINSNMRRRFARQGKTPDEIDRVMVTDSYAAFANGLAYEASMRAKLQGKNAVAAEYNAMLGKLEKSGDLGAAVAALLKIESPIIKIPLNYASEIFSYVPFGGMVKAISKYGAATHEARVIRRDALKTPGADREATEARFAKDKQTALEAGAADYIVRNIKKQTVGVGMFALGFFGYQYFGGLWREHKEQPNPDIEVGGIQTPLGQVSHHLTHSAFVGIAQMGALAHYAMLEDMDKAEKAGDEGDALAGALKGFGQGAMSMLLDVPVFALPKDIDMLAQGQFQKVAGNKVRQFIPSEVGRWAKSGDTDDNGDPIKRKPKGIVDELKMGIPGLREQVPTE